MSSSWCGWFVGISLQSPESTTTPRILTLGQPFVFHTLADIESISESTGSDNGGQYLTITGKNTLLKKWSIVSIFRPNKFPTYCAIVIIGSASD